MNIPNFIDAQVINKNGYLTDVWRQIFIQLFTELQINFSEEGIIIPKQTNSNIISLSGTDGTGKLLYNKDLDKLMVNIAGIFKEVQTV